MSDLDTSHGFPTTNYGCASDLLCPPFYFSNCNYNGAVAVLQQMVSSVANGTIHDPPGFEGTLSTFDQEEFFDGDAEAMSMATIGRRGLRLRATPVWRWAPGRVFIWPSSRSRRSHPRSRWFVDKVPSPFQLPRLHHRRQLCWRKLHQAHQISPSSRCPQRCYCVPTNCVKFSQPPWLLGLAGVPWGHQRPRLYHQEWTSDEGCFGNRSMKKSQYIPCFKKSTKNASFLAFCCPPVDSLDD